MESNAKIGPPIFKSRRYRIEQQPNPELPGRVICVVIRSDGFVIGQHATMREAEKQCARCNRAGS